jgi:hypothetical protein
VVALIGYVDRFSARPGERIARPEKAAHDFAGRAAGEDHRQGKPDLREPGAF